MLVDDDVEVVDDKFDSLILFLSLRISMCCRLILIGREIDRMLVGSAPA